MDSPAPPTLAQKRLGAALDQAQVLLKAKHLEFSVSDQIAAAKAILEIEDRAAVQTWLDEISFVDCRMPHDEVRRIIRIVNIGDYPFLFTT